MQGLVQGLVQGAERRHGADHMRPRGARLPVRRAALPRERLLPGQYVAGEPKHKNQFFEIIKDNKILRFVPK